MAEEDRCLAFIGPADPEADPPRIEGGSDHGVRFAGLSGDRFAFASGRAVRVCSFAVPKRESYESNLLEAKQGSVRYFPVRLTGCSSATLGIDGGIAGSNAMESGDAGGNGNGGGSAVGENWHACDVETLAGYGDGQHVVSIDAAGAAAVWNTGTGGDGSPSAAPLATFRSIPALGECEFGWCGVAATGSGPSDPIVVARQSGKDLALVDTAAPGGPRVTWSTTSLGRGPLALVHTGDLAAVLEHNELCLWDTRDRRVAHRSSYGLSQLLCCAVTREGNIMFSGSEKVLRVYDVRAGRVTREIKSVTKQDTVKIAPGPGGFTFVAGLDNEIMCGEYKGAGGRQKPHNGFMADARWVGLHASADGRLTGLTTSGTAYVITNASQMAAAR